MWDAPRRRRTGPRPDGGYAERMQAPQPAVAVRTWSVADAAAATDAVVDAYAAAFEGPPYDEGASARRRFAPRWAAHRAAPGWRGVAAWRDGVLVGFGYGHALVPGLSWSDTLVAHLAPSTRTKWTEDAFLLCELAVRPEHQGQGVGSTLRDALLAEAPHATALLTTLDDRTNAGARLYARRGWRRLSAPFVAPGYAHRYVVLGVRLDRCA